MIKEEIRKIASKAILSAFGDIQMPEIVVDYSDGEGHGEYTTNVAMRMANVVEDSPLKIAEKIKKAIKSDLFEKVEVAKPGFVNFFVSEEYLKNQIKETLKQKDKFGAINIGKNEKINVEFISANPTGPLTLGNGRGGFCGDVLANVLAKAGYKVTREYYINDRGAQITKLGHSVLKDAEAVYKGDYIDELNRKLLGGRTSLSGGPTSAVSAEAVGGKAAKYILDKMIKPSIKKMGVKFDVWFSEKTLYKDKSVDRAIENLSKRGFTYESEKAIWFKCKELEDDKDRVLIRADGEETYFASDIAYLKNKFQRGFKKLFFFLGADHYGYVARLEAAADALGYKKEQIETIVMQLVRLLKDGKEVKMSKRTGVYVTLDELLDEVGLDVARFFFLQRSANTHLNFDLNLAKEHSQKNPVYYVQYAHARICSILKKAKGLKNKKPNLDFLVEKEEMGLIKQIQKLPEIISDTANDYQVQRLTQYATDVADAFHQFYEKCRVISEDKNLTSARLALAQAAKIVLENTLDLMGISAPEKM